MPNQHFDAKVISRNGRHRSRAKAVASAAYNAGSKVAALGAAALTMHTSVVASAAYRSGEALYDMQVEKIYDYSHKDEVIYSEILTPSGAPAWAADRQFLWNMVEKAEKRKDAQLARDIIAALPRELNHEQQIALARDFVQEQFVSQGMVCDLCLHDKTASDGRPQPHMHVMLTMRSIDAAGFGRKDRAWNKKELLLTWRNAWAETTNRHLQMAGRSERLDLRSYAEQGIDKIPGEHMGPDAWNLEQQHDVETDKGDHNRDIRQANAVREVARNHAGLAGEPPAFTDQRDAGLIISSWDEHAQRADNAGATGGQQAVAGANLDPATFTDAQLDALHQVHVRTTLAGRVQRSMRSVAENINRLRAYGRTVLAWTRSVFDRYAVETMRHDPQRERGIPER